MNSIGVLFLWLAFGFGVCAIFFATFGISRKQVPLIRLARILSILSAAAVVGSALVLVRAFVTDDFSFAYVVRNSQRRLPQIYKISALWAGQSGSLLLWLAILSLFTCWLHGYRRYHVDCLDLKLSIVTNLVRLLFIAILLLITSPFEGMDIIPRDGRGLNPMLQSMGMVVHPPVLFIGFSACLIQCAFFIVDLWDRNSEGSQEQSLPWILLAWTMLTAGIVTGGQWAYSELGWGGYWAWDPVENALLFPWLSTTALIHVLILPSDGKRKKLWSYSLSMLTFLLTVFGTYLTRSGILDSVHTFSSDTLGNVFFIVIASVSVFFVYLGISRRTILLDDSLDAVNGKGWLSKQTAILAGQLLLLLILAVVLLGTMFPKISSTFMGREIVLSDDFYNLVSIPLFVAVFFLMGMAPLLDWKASAWNELLRKLWLPGLVGVGSGLFVYKASAGHVLGSLSAAVSGFGLITHVFSFGRCKEKRKLGAYIVHVGAILMLLGVLGSSVFVEDTFQTVSPGESIQIGEYLLKYGGLKLRWGIDHHSVVAAVDIFHAGKSIGTLTSEKTFYGSSAQPYTEVGIFTTWQGDIYLNLVGWQKQTAQLHVQRFPLVNWIWMGAWIVYLGALVIALPMPRRWQVHRGGGLQDDRSVGSSSVV